MVPDSVQDHIGDGSYSVHKKTTKGEKWTELEPSPTRSGMAESVGLGGPLRRGGVHGFGQGDGASG